MQPWRTQKFTIDGDLRTAGGALGFIHDATEHPRRGATLNNMLSVLIDPEAVGDLASFDNEGVMINYIYASTPAAGVDRVPPKTLKERLPHTEQTV